MTGPPRPEQWGTGIPGIPSMWDSPAVGDVADRMPPAQSPAGPWAPPAGVRRDSGPVRSYRWGLAAALAVLLVLGGAALRGAGEQVFVIGGPEPFGVLEAPAQDGAVPLPPPPPFPPPGPAAGPQSGSDLWSETTAARADGGEPFGLPLGATVVLRDALSGSRLDVQPLAVSRRDGLVLVQVELSAQQSPTSAGVPPLVLRLPDGRDLGLAEVRGDGPGAGMPSLLQPGEAVRVELGYDGGSGAAVLVLDAGSALAGWTVPAEG